MELLAAGVNHTTADLALRERLTFSQAQISDALDRLRELPQVREAALLSTCNRTEIYCVFDGTSPDLVTWIARERQVSPEALRRAFYQFHGADGLRHMMRVASGLDSMVLGEPQILGQMRDAYARAQAAGALQGELDWIFQQVFGIAKRIRTETGIGTNPVSVAYAAVSFAKHIFADLRQSRVLLIGAGEMIELVARHLREQQVAGMTLVNRTLARAAELADAVGGDCATLEELPELLNDADIVISCTASPVPILGKGVVERALRKRRHRPIFMVDIAVPRDIEPEVGELQDIYLYTVDDLHEAIEENLRSRQEAARQAENLIEVALTEMDRSRREQEAVETLRTYREQVQRMTQRELEKALTQLRNGGDPTVVAQRLQHAITGKLLHGPSIRLRQLAAEGRLDALALAREILLHQDAES